MTIDAKHGIQAEGAENTMRVNPNAWQLECIVFVVSEYSFEKLQSFFAGKRRTVPTARVRKLRQCVFGVSVKPKHVKGQRLLAGKREVPSEVEKEQEGREDARVAWK